MPKYKNISNRTRYLPDGYVARGVLVTPNQEVTIPEYLNPNIPDMVNFQLTGHTEDTNPIIMFSENDSGLTGTAEIVIPWSSGHIDVLLIVSEGTGTLAFNSSAIKLLDLSAGTFRFDEMLSRYLYSVTIVGSALKYKFYCIRRR